MDAWHGTKSTITYSDTAINNNNNSNKTDHDQAGRQNEQDGVIYSREQIAKRQILAEVAQREAVKRISAKYDSAGIGIRSQCDSNSRDNLDVSCEQNNDDKTRDICGLVTSCENKVSYKDCANNMDPIVISEADETLVKRSSKTPAKPTRKRPESSGYKSGGTSDAASDISGKSTRSGSSGFSSSHENSDCVTSENVTLTELDIAQVELFYQSHKTDVFVCKCMANIYFGHVTQKLVKEHDWKLYATGIPVLVLDTGMHHRMRRLYFIIAERGTGFVLWKDVLDNLSNYASPHAHFHTLQISTDHTKLAGISFDENAAAADFLQVYEKFTSNPEDDLMKLSANRKSKKDKRKSNTVKYKGPKKTEISQPCCFVHMTTLQRPDVAPICTPEYYTADEIFDDNTVANRQSLTITEQSVYDDNSQNTQQNGAECDYRVSESETKVKAAENEATLDILQKSSAVHEDLSTPQIQLFEQTVVAPVMTTNVEQIEILSKTVTDV